jgi:hypothetical protein
LRSNISLDLAINPLAKYETKSVSEEKPDQSEL